MPLLLAVASFLICTTLYGVPLAYAADFQPMVGIPGLDTNGSYTMVELVNRLYLFLITIGAIIGVIKIAFAGVKWATSVSGGSISAAKEDIKGVILGLIILMLPYIVLSAINPKFARLNVLNLDTLTLPQSSESRGGRDSSGGNGEEGPKQCPGICRDDPVGKCAEFRNRCTQAPGTPMPTPIELGRRTITQYGCSVEPSVTCPDLSGTGN